MAIEIGPLEVVQFTSPVINFPSILTVNFISYHVIRGFDDGVERLILAYNFILIWQRNDFRLNTDKTNPLPLPVYSPGLM